MLSKDLKKKLTEHGVSNFIFPYHIEQQEIAIQENDTLGKCGCKVISPETGTEIEMFTLEQYECISKISSTVLACQEQLGGNDNILLGGLFSSSNEKVPKHEVFTFRFQITSSSWLSYYYLSEIGLKRLGIDSSIVQIKPINENSFSSIQEWESIIAESRLVGIIEGGKSERLLMHHWILDNKPEWIQMLDENDLIPVAIEDNNKFLICHPDISLENINQEKYNQLVDRINPTIENLFQ